MGCAACDSLNEWNGPGDKKQFCMRHTGRRECPMCQSVNQNNSLGDPFRPCVKHDGKAD